MGWRKWNEPPSKGPTRGRRKSAAYRAPFVAGEGKTQTAQAALGRGKRHPALMDLDGKSVNTQDVAIAIAKICHMAADRGQLCRSDEPKIARVEQNHQPAVSIIRKVDAPPTGLESRRAKQRKIRRSCADHCALRHGKWLLPGPELI